MHGLAALMLVIACLSPGTAGAGTDDPNAAEFFEKQIRPLFAEKCHKCHGVGKTRGGLSLTGRDLLLKGGDSGPAAVPGKPKESLLVEAVEHRGELKMPPNGKLSATEIDRLRHWIEIGMPWPDARVTSCPASSGFRRQADRWRRREPGGLSSRCGGPILPRSRILDGRAPRSTGSSWPASRRAD